MDDFRWGEFSFSFWFQIIGVELKGDLDVNKFFFHHSFDKDGNGACLAVHNEAVRLVKEEENVLQSWMGVGQSNRKFIEGEWILPLSEGGFTGKVKGENMVLQVCFEVVVELVVFEEVDGFHW